VSAGGSSKVDLGRAKSVGEIIGDALHCYASYPALFATLTLAVVVPYAVIVRLVEQANLIGGTRHGALAALVLVLIEVLLVGPLISALHVHAVVELGAQRVPRVREVFARGVRVLPVVAAAQVVVAVSAAIEDQRHQPAADRQRNHNAASNGNIAVKRDGVAAHSFPGGAGKPKRCRQQREKCKDDQRTHAADIGSPCSHS